MIYSPVFFELWNRRVCRKGCDNLVLRIVDGFSQSNLCRLEKISWLSSRGMKLLRACRISLVFSTSALSFIALKKGQRFENGRTEQAVEPGTEEKNKMSLMGEPDRVEQKERRGNF